MLKLKFKKTLNFMYR